MLLSDFPMKTNNWIKISVISSIPSKFLLSGFLLLVCTLVRYVYQGNDSVIHLASSVLNTWALFSSTKISLVYQRALPNSEAFIKYHRVEVRLLWLVCYPRSKYVRGTDPFLPPWRATNQSKCRISITLATFFYWFHWLATPKGSKPIKTPHFDHLWYWDFVIVGPAIMRYGRHTRASYNMLQLLMNALDGGRPVQYKVHKLVALKRDCEIITSRKFHFVIDKKNGMAHANLWIFRIWNAVYIYIYICSIYCITIK